MVDEENVQYFKSMSEKSFIAETKNFKLIYMPLYAIIVFYLFHISSESGPLIILELYSL